MWSANGHSAGYEIFVNIWLRVASRNDNSIFVTLCNNAKKGRRFFANKKATETSEAFQHQLLYRLVRLTP
ncbi:MAG: hypothetical protein EBT90_01535 [Rhodobacteraceae bacterium]|nr:hypothetical protein [Paracoccaceae bacterium]